MSDLTRTLGTEVFVPKIKILRFTQDDTSAIVILSYSEESFLVFVFESSSRHTESSAPNY